MSPRDIKDRRSSPARDAVHLSGSRRSASGIPPPRLVHPVNFVIATRDTGYRTTSQAIAEFVDNSIQAGARSVNVDVLDGADNQYPIELLVTDDGQGMDAHTLALALTFGGSTRFGDRCSLGRYGMGLPNGGLSQARRVEVFTWQDAVVLTTYLDVDEIAQTGRPVLPPISRPSRPTFLPRSRHGTAILLRRCDRLDYRRKAYLSRKLHEELGRIYRYFLRDGFTLRVDGRAVRPVDPLFLSPVRDTPPARQFGSTLRYRFPGSGGDGSVAVTFSELPVEALHALAVNDKRRLGITAQPCVSIVRAEREIDRGWYFMGGKRRENYDDWWRCEVQFDPVLDELFGVTHSKQTISPRDELLQALVPDLEPIGRALNQHIRQRFEGLKVSDSLSAAERQAARADSALPQLAHRRDLTARELLSRMNVHLTIPTDDRRPYRLVVSDLPTTMAFDVGQLGRTLIVFLNGRHPFYRDLYGPLATSASQHDQDIARQIALVVLAAARAEASTGRKSREELKRYRQVWTDTLAAFFTA